MDKKRLRLCYWLQLTGDGKCYYNEWNKGAQPDFSNVSKPATAKVTDNVGYLAGRLSFGF